MMMDTVSPIMVSGVEAADYSPMTHQLAHQFTPCHRPRHQDGQTGQDHDSSNLKANLHVSVLLLKHHKETFIYLFFLQLAAFLFVAIRPSAVQP